MRIDEAGNDDVAGKIDDLVGLRGQTRRRPYGNDPAAFDEDAAAAYLAPRSIHRDDEIGISGEQSSRHRALVSGFGFGRFGL
jgi:hypothetical protein